MRPAQFRPKHTEIWSCEVGPLLGWACKEKWPLFTVCHRLCWEETELSKVGLLGAGRMGLVNLHEGEVLVRLWGS